MRCASGCAGRSRAGTDASGRRSASTRAMRSSMLDTMPATRSEPTYSANEKGGTAAAPQSSSHRRRSLRRDTHLGRGGAHVGVDLLLVFHEVLLEHAHELARGLVAGR